MKKMILLVAAFCSLANFGQAINKYDLIDQQIFKIPAASTGTTKDIANFIKKNFKTENEQIRAVFYWTTFNISYDIENMFTPNFNITKEDKIKKALETRKGVCINYAEVFNDIANKVGIETYIIEGYTRQKGFAGYIPHAWCAAKIDNKWCIFDPTWGSGYTSEGQFFKKINDFYFKSDPNKIIATHMPFDYMWQFLHYPITNQEFYSENFVENKAKARFDFDAELKKYKSLSYLDQLISSANRIEQNGIENAIVLNRLSDKKREIESIKFNQIVNLYNEGVGELNTFITFRNKQFQPNIADEELKKMIDSPRSKFLKSKELLDNFEPISKNNQATLTSLATNINKIVSQTEEHFLFVEKYLSKSKIDRKSMFIKVSFFDMPVN